MPRGSHRGLRKTLLAAALSLPVLLVFPVVMPANATFIEAQPDEVGVQAPQMHLSQIATVPFNTVVVEDDELPIDVEVVSVEGEVGRTHVYTDTYAEGSVPRFRSEVVDKPVDRVIRRGTKDPLPFVSEPEPEPEPAPEPEAPLAGPEQELPADIQDTQETQESSAPAQAQPAPQPESAPEDQTAAAPQPKPAAPSQPSAKPTPKPKPQEKPKPAPEKPKAPSSSATYSLRDLTFMGIINWNGYKYTYYSQSVLPGGGLRIPGRHVNAAGFVSDGDGYIVLAAPYGVNHGTVFPTPFGYTGKVYDTCGSCTTSPMWLDVYTR